MFVYFVHQLFRLFRVTKTKFLYIFAVFAIFSWVLSFHIKEMNAAEKLISVDFEVFGKVQGVFFRKYTEQQANRLGLRGWCMNTHQDTVKGVIEGTPSKINEMKLWLEKTGSPQSRIEKAVFANAKVIGKSTYDKFKIKR